MILALTSAACTSGSGDPVPPLPGSGILDTGQSYPDGPFGTTVGKTINNYVFPGYARPAAGLGEANRQEISLGDFFNPTGDGTFPADSVFGAGEPLPRALVVNVSAVWCGPCKQEALSVLPGEYDHFKPLGGEIMMVLADSADPGVAADFENLDNWISAFEGKYPAVIDPEYQMGSLFDTSSFPANFIIDTKDMTIAEVVKGVPQDSFWTKLESLLTAAAGPN